MHVTTPVFYEIGCLWNLCEHATQQAGWNDSKVYGCKAAQWLQGAREKRWGITVKVGNVFARSIYAHRVSIDRKNLLPSYRIWTKRSLKLCSTVFSLYSALSMVCLSLLLLYSIFSPPPIPSSTPIPQRTHTLFLFLSVSLILSLFPLLALFLNLHPILRTHILSYSSIYHLGIYFYTIKARMCLKLSINRTLPSGCFSCVVPLTTSNARSFSNWRLVRWL